MIDQKNVINRVWGPSAEDQEMLDRLEIACYALCRRSDTNKYGVTTYSFKDDTGPSWLRINRSYVNTIRIEPNMRTRTMVDQVFGTKHLNGYQWEIPKGWTV